MIEKEITLKPEKKLLLVLHFTTFRKRLLTKFTYNEEENSIQKNIFKTYLLLLSVYRKNVLFISLQLAKVTRQFSKRTVFPVHTKPIHAARTIVFKVANVGLPHNSFSYRRHQVNPWTWETLSGTVDGSSGDFVVKRSVHFVYVCPCQ